MKIKHEYIDQYDWVYSDYIDKVAGKYAPKIGEFLITFSSLEHTLDIAIADFISDRSHDLGYLVLEGNNLYNKIELFRKLSHSFIVHICPNKIKRLNIIVKRLHDARVFRNYISHANWSSLERSGYVRTQIAEKEGEIIFKKVRITPDKIESWNRRVQRLDEQISDYVETLSNSLLKNYK